MQPTLPSAVATLPPALWPASLDRGRLVADRYRIEGELGRGSMGAVYRAVDIALDMPLAIKVLLPSAAANARTAERFRREAPAAGRIGSPHVVEVFAAGRLDNGALYIVMELCEGQTLATRLARSPMALGEAVGIGLQMLDGVGAAHAAGVIHRDLKPANVMLVPHDDGALVKILDFGIAKLLGGDGPLTRTNDLLGTPAYMAPEQLRHPRSIDARAYLFAVGATLFEAATGRTLRRARSVRELLRFILAARTSSVATAAPELPTAWVSFLDRAMAIEPDQRFASAIEMRAALELLG
jgi:serine/threonine-protein kinase